MSMDREELEEAAAQARDVARICKAQFDAFHEAGFSEPQSLRLTMSWLRASMQRDVGEEE
jgi:hypothetical protein